MRDFYIEQLVKRRNTKRSGLLKILLLLGGCASVMLVKVSPFLVVVPLAVFFCILKYFRVTSVEYEYVFFNGNIDIDKVMSKTSRKRLISTGLHEVEVVAPTGSLEIQQYRKVKKYNYSSRRKGVTTYQMVINHKGRRARIVFEPNEEFLKEMKLSSPRKVFF